MPLSTPPSTRPDRPLRGRTVLFSLLAFFGVVVGVNAVMITLAVRTLPGTEVDSAYRASLAYNGQIAAAREQDERGWRVAARIERAADGHAAIQVEARDAQGAPVPGLAFTARLQRPTDKRADRIVPLAERASGVYAGAAEEVAGGQWELVLEAERAAGRVFLSRNRIVLK